MHEHHLIGNTPICPNCKKDQDGALGGQTAPKNGSICICAYCAVITIYEVIGNAYKLRMATATDFSEMQDEGVLAKIYALQDYVKSKIEARKSK